MKIKKLNFSNAYIFDIPDEDILCFMKPLQGKLYRIKIPEIKSPEKKKELIQVLNTLCVRLHNNIWYFKIPDEETEKDIQAIFVEMGYYPLLILIEGAPSLSN